jgi:FkbM family methyltransferase
MPALRGLVKPCYVFAPRTLVRRIGMIFLHSQRSVAEVRLPWGALLEVNPEETIGRELLRQGVFDIAVTETVWRLLEPGDVAVDVGANIGYLTGLFAVKVGPSGQVVSFEPHPRIFARLRRNARNLGNQDSQASIALHECALGSRDGTARLLEPSAFRMNEGTSMLAGFGTQVPADSEGFEVKLARLDTILAGCDIAMLKVDVEGGEAEVFAGAERLLVNRKIRHIIYEAHDCARSPLHALLSGYGYSVFGIGHDLFGLKITPGTSAPKVDRSWESPSYLATLRPDVVLPTLRARGWQVLRGC